MEMFDLIAFINFTGVRCLILCDVGYNITVPNNLVCFFLRQTTKKYKREMKRHNHRFIYLTRGKKIKLKHEYDFYTLFIGGKYNKKVY